MSVARGYVGGGLDRPASLLAACLFWDRCQAGMIDHYLPRLHWDLVTGPARRGMGPVPVWHLMLDDRPIGWTQSPKRKLPAIHADLSPNLLDYLPIGCEWIE